MLFQIKLDNNVQALGFTNRITKTCLVSVIDENKAEIVPASEPQSEPELEQDAPTTDKQEL